MTASRPMVKLAEPGFDSATKLEMIEARRLQSWQSLALIQLPSSSMIADLSQSKAAGHRQMSPRGDPMRTPQGPMGTPCGPMETPWGPMETPWGPMGGHGDPWGPHGDQREGHGDPGGPMGTMGGEKSFFTGAWPKPRPRLESAHKSSQAQPRPIKARLNTNAACVN